ncbi:AMP nucleosidase [Entomobacter blattae]|uniref:AMP nucleosidase n=1 Tax=Entomobacter blattae TaxID=2762277 RepID=A0A7H1NTA7_9PROT|nr:AMP nucleosidase [Entomobacter blattae]QNT79017.1 AMP nucleosidase [Entomobacter blattae]
MTPSYSTKNTSSQPDFDTVGCHFESFTDADKAVEKLIQIYETNTEKLKKAFLNKQPGASKECVYPYLAFIVPHGHSSASGRPPYDVVLDTGFYGTTITRPTLFKNYLSEQITSLMSHYQLPVYVGYSHSSIPLPYVIENAVTDMTADELIFIQDNFFLPNLHTTNDSIANCETLPLPGQVMPLSLFTAERVDYSLARLAHYTGTQAEHFQRFILLTNYQRYIDSFCTYGMEQVDLGTEYSNFVAPEDKIYTKKKKNFSLPDSLPQMPAYHLCREDGNGITMVNIGVGPANAKTITDHLAVLRPHCWLMLGHCAGLRRTQKLGDYVLAHGYLRADNILDDEIPTWVPIPAIAEVQVALQEVTAQVTGLEASELKTRMRTGTVLTTDNRNWELRLNTLFQQINMSRSIAVDMESATIAANGFRFRVPYGTLLCVSDKPLHGELKLRGMANAFYRERINQHLTVGIETMRLLRKRGVDTLHSRKLRGFFEPAFR